MKFNSIYAGMTCYTVSKHLMGNTTMRTVAVHEVKVISCDSVKETVVASWNHNQPRTYTERDYSKWRAKEPLLVGEICKRLATREEIAAHKASGAA